MPPRLAPPSEDPSGYGSEGPPVPRGALPVDQGPSPELLGRARPVSSPAVPPGCSPEGREPEPPSLEPWHPGPVSRWRSAVHSPPDPTGSGHPPHGLVPWGWGFAAPVPVTGARGRQRSLEPPRLPSRRSPARPLMLARAPRCPPCHRSPLAPTPRLGATPYPDPSSVSRGLGWPHRPSTSPVPWPHPSARFFGGPQAGGAEVPWLGRAQARPEPRPLPISLRG